MLTLHDAVAAAGLIPCAFVRARCKRYGDLRIARRVWKPNRKLRYALHRASSWAAHLAHVEWFALVIGNCDQHRGHRVDLSQCGTPHPTMALRLAGGQSRNWHVVGRNNAFWLVREQPC